MRNKSRGYIKQEKSKGNIYLSRIGLIITYTVIGYITTMITDYNIKKILTMVGVLGVMSLFNVIVSIVECQQKSNMIILILDLLLVIVVFADIFSIIHSYDKNAFKLNNDGVPYLELLYFSFVTFTTLGYGDILPLTYIAKFTAVTESFMFTCIVAFVVLNFSEPMKEYLALYKED